MAKPSLIEHRKFGVGVFVPNANAEEQNAKKIVTLIKRGVNVAAPFFEWLAQKAVQESKLNVNNNSRSLYERFEYLLSMYRKVFDEAESKNVVQRVEGKETREGESILVRYPSFSMKKNAEWLAMAAIDVFFSWTEHIFIHLTILDGKITSGIEVAKLADADWQTKFKQALDLNEIGMRKLYDDLVLIRRQLRNFMAHGAFGKQGEAFKFHSAAGAVPVLLPHQLGKQQFALTGTLAFKVDAAIEVIEKFISQLWSGKRTASRLYIQESDLPLILTMARDGTYKKAMQSVEEMKEFLERLAWSFDSSANMDW